MCEVDDQQADRKFHSQTMELFSARNCKANTDQESRSDNVDVINTNSNMPDYLKSSTDREADTRASWLITQRIHNEIIDVFIGIESFDGTLRLQVKDASQPYEESLGG